MTRVFSHNVLREAMIDPKVEKVKHFKDDNEEQDEISEARYVSSSRVSLARGAKSKNKKYEL